MAGAGLSAWLYAFCLWAGKMYHLVHVEKRAKSLQLHWLERSLGVLWGEIKRCMYKECNSVWKLLKLSASAMVCIVGDSSSALKGDSALGLPAGDSSSRFWGKSASASVAFSIVGDSSSGLQGDSGIRTTCWWLLLGVLMRVSLSFYASWHSWFLKPMQHAKLTG